MITLILTGVIIAAFFKFFVWLFKVAWGVSKVIAAILFLPLILFVAVCTGLIYVAVIALIIGGVVWLIREL